MDKRSEFEALLYERLIPEFCGDPVRKVNAAGFKAESNKISEQDAGYFLKAWRAGLISHVGRGIYFAPQSKVGEQLFWEGLKANVPRSFTLWLEPLITVGGLARLHFDHGWPKVQLGCQSSDGAFDLFTTPADLSGEFIAGEVKKTSRELDALILHMGRYGSDPLASIPIKNGKGRNAYKKVIALRERRPPIFWALGPDGDSRVFSVEYSDDGTVEFCPASQHALTFPSA